MADDNQRYTCTICCTRFGDPVQTPCGHHFCRACIERWLRENTVCPIDRRPLTADALFADEALRREIQGLNTASPNNRGGTQVTRPTALRPEVHRAREVMQQGRAQSPAIRDLTPEMAPLMVAAYRHRPEEGTDWLSQSFECCTGSTDCELGTCDDFGLCGYFDACCGRGFCKNIIAGVICLICLPVLFFAKIAIGSMYYYECPVEPLIPVYLVVSGSFDVLSILFTVSRVAASDERLRGILVWVAGFLYVFTFAWFIAGCVWVYGTMAQQHISSVHTDANYCAQTVYGVAFCVTTINLALIVAIPVLMLGQRYIGEHFCHRYCPPYRTYR